MRRAQTLYGRCAGAAQQAGAFYIRTCALPNTFQTWFAITQLHVWITIARLRREGDGGRDASAALVDAFIQDVEIRMGKLGVSPRDGRKGQGRGTRGKRPVQGLGLAWRPARRTGLSWAASLEGGTALERARPLKWC